MKKYFLIVLLCIYTSDISAQQESFRIQGVIDACIALRDAVAENDTSAIRKSAIKLKSAGSVRFANFRCKDKTLLSLNGHLVFNEIFADSLADGNTDVYNNADRINRAKTHRGQTADGSYLTQTCFVKAGESTIYIFSAKGYQELAVVAEAGGLITMKIHVTNSTGFDRRYDDTKKVKTGLQQRKTSFMLPKDVRNNVEVEIVNCGKKDCSFVIISN